MNTILLRNCERKHLLEHLGFPGGKLPKDFTFDGVLPLQNWGGDSYGDFHIIVKAHEPRTRVNFRHETVLCNSSRHRIFAKFGERLIPVGRLAQAKI
jgi:hypothetical protein